MSFAGFLTTCLYVLICSSDLLVIQEVNGLLPQVHQEGILRPFKSYADVTLFHYYVPKEASVATFEFAAFHDNQNCPVREAFVFLQHGSYPVMSADNSTFPKEFWVNRTSFSRIVIRSSYQSHDAKVFPIYNPLPGSWFAAAYLNTWDQKVQQEGLGHKCRYSLGSVALWSQVSDVSTIALKTTSRLTSTKHFTYYKFYIPSGVNLFTLKIEECHFLTSRWFPESLSANATSKKGETPCIHNVFIRERALPFYISNKTDGIVSNHEGSSYTHVEKLPRTDSYYYLMIVSESRVSYNVTILVDECPSWTLGKSLIQQFAGLINTSTSTSSAEKHHGMQMNISTAANFSSTERNFTTSKESHFTHSCNCVPTFRLTRTKHAQDFSDTFLLEGKEWFTTWLALTDSNPEVPVIGTSFELLPFVDIGGTLTIGIHLDELLMNATTQIVHVNACIRKGRPPETFCCDYLSENNTGLCCESGLDLHVTSRNLSEVNDAKYIPFPEPDTYYISFKMHCEFQGEVVQCAFPEALISLDIQTSPCVLSKHFSHESSISPCGSFGYCQEVHKGQFFYTACRCVGGYKGWACTDDSEATPEHILIMTTLLLTLSNLFFIPAIWLALRRTMFVQAFIYFCTMISSTVYHACDQDIYGYCLTRYTVLQFCDFFCSILAFWVTLISLAHSPPKYDSLLYILGCVVIAIGVEYNRTGLLVFVIPFAMGFAFVICIWMHRSIKRRTIITPKVESVLLFLPGVLLGASGLVLFAFVETEDNYRYTHSAWHAIIAISLLYLLPKKPVVRVDLMANGSVAELAPVNSDYQQSSASPVFFVTSELDHLVQQ